MRYQGFAIGNAILHMSWIRIDPAFKGYCTMWRAPSSLASSDNGKEHNAEVNERHDSRNQIPEP